MNCLIVLLIMLFLHIVDDFYLQGKLAQFKQKEFWDDYCSKASYDFDFCYKLRKFHKWDYIPALLCHAFSWTFMIHIPLYINYKDKLNDYSGFLFVLFFVWMLIYALVDDEKANRHKINLWQDQLIHLFQIIGLWMIWVIL